MEKGTNPKSKLYGCQQPKKEKEREGEKWYIHALYGVNVYVCPILHLRSWQAVYLVCTEYYFFLPMMCRRRPSRLIDISIADSMANIESQYGVERPWLKGRRGGSAREN